MRANLLVALMVVLFGVGISILLIPRGGELALQKFRDLEFDAARDAYEQRYADGDRSAATVMPLTKLYLSDGSVDRAIAVLEDFVSRDPNPLDGRELLLRLYQDAQRKGDYLDTLFELMRQKPDEDRFRELIALAGFQGRLDVQEAAIARYLETLRPDDVEMEQVLAGLLAARGDHAASLARLIHADDLAKGMIEADSRELLLSLLIDLDKEDEAFPRVQRWLGEKPTIADTIGLASQFASAGRPDLGMKLIEPAVAKPGHPLALELTYIDLALAAGRTDEARTRLLALPGPIDDQSFGRTVALMMNAGLGRPALARAQGRDLRLIPDWALAGLADTAFRDRDRAFLDRMVTELGDAFLAARPVLAANIALGRGDIASAVRWAERAAADPDQPLPDRLSAVALLDRADRKEEAVQALDRLPLGTAGPDGVPDDLLDQLAFLFLDLDRGAEGLAWFDRRRVSAPSPLADFGWARIAARHGEPQAVIAWMDTQRRLEEGLLQDIASAAADRGSATLALKAAERVFAQSPSPRSRAALAAALMTADRPDEALPHLRQLLAAGMPEVETNYLAALDRLGLFEELSEFLAAKVARGGLSDEEEQAIVYALLDRRAYRAALPILRGRAVRLGGEWLYAYADAARRGGAVQELAGLLEVQIADPKFDATAREQRAYLLMEVAGPQRALPVLRRMAATASGGPWDTLYRETLEKLGRDEELTDYLTVRLARSDLTEEEQQSLLYALLDRKAYKAALPGLRARAQKLGGEWLFAYADAARKADAEGELIELLEAQIAGPALDPAGREQRVYLLLEVAGPARALPVLRRMAMEMAGGPWDGIYREALERLGREEELVAYIAGRLDRGGLEEQEEQALVYVLLDRKTYAPALPSLRRRAARLGGEWLFAYADAARKVGAESELTGFLEEQIAGGRLDPAGREQAANLLLEVAGPERSLPVLRQMAMASGSGPWEALYRDTLEKLGRDSELVAHLTDRLAAGTLDDATEQAAIFALLDRKAYRAALPALMKRAEREVGQQGGGQWLFAYADAARGAGALDELADLLERQLADPALDAAGREQRAFLLLEVAGAERALPTLRLLASASVTGPWDGLYREALEKLGRKAELRQYILARAANPRVPAPERRQLAFVLLEQGDKPATLQVLQSLAAGQGPQSEDFRQLAYLWGPRPPPGALDWIEARARTARNPAEQAAWYGRLAELGGARRVADALGQGGTPAAADLKSPFIEALAAEGKGRELAEAVRSATVSERDPERLRRYARLSEQARQRGAAAEAWKALLSLRPEDGDAMRQLGMLAYDENRLEEAERLLRRYLARGAGDYEANYFLGEALSALKRNAAAVPFYKRALEQIRAGTARSDAVAQTEANLLNRLGRVDEAVTLFERLRKVRPNDRQLKADYASMLIENGRGQEARRVLSLP